MLLWITYMLLLYLPFDLSIVLCATLLNRRRRYRERTVAILRYSVSAMLALWFVIAIIPQKPFWSATGSGAYGTLLSSLPILYRHIRDAAILWSLAPLLSGVFVVSWSNSTTTRNKILRLGVAGAILSLCTYIVYKPSLPIMYATGRQAFPDQDPRPVAPPPADISLGKKLGVGPLRCQLSKSGSMQVAAAVLNDSELPAALDTEYLQVWIERGDLNLLHPDFLKLPLRADGKHIVVFQPRSAVVLNARVNIPQKELIRLGQSCALEYHDAQRTGIQFLSQSASILTAELQTPR